MIGSKHTIRAENPCAPGLICLNTLQMRLTQYYIMQKEERVRVRGECPLTTAKLIKINNGNSSRAINLRIMAGHMLRELRGKPRREFSEPILIAYNGYYLLVTPLIPANMHLRAFRVDMNLYTIL